MARGNIAAALEELREERDRINGAIEVLEKLVAPVTAPVNGGARKAVRQKAVVPEKPRADGKRKYHKHCDECGADYTAPGPRSPCPRCNPKIVTAKDIK